MFKTTVILILLMLASCASTMPPTQVSYTCVNSNDKLICERQPRGEKCACVSLDSFERFRRELEPLDDWTK